mmetsp:Transcript_765/g.2724  ORF Transcript_765/g.2724 Transcript_765/m.2724 type:complete len:220 (-) Transcript_765:133-792(-)
MWVRALRASVAGRSACPHPDVAFSAQGRCGAGHVRTRTCDGARRRRPPRESGLGIACPVGRVAHPSHRGLSQTSLTTRAHRRVAGRGASAATRARANGGPQRRPRQVALGVDGPLVGRRGCSRDSTRTHRRPPLLRRRRGALPACARTTRPGGHSCGRRHDRRIHASLDFHCRRPRPSADGDGGGGGEHTEATSGAWGRFRRGDGAAPSAPESHSGADG